MSIFMDQERSIAGYKMRILCAVKYIVSHKVAVGMQEGLALQTLETLGAGNLPRRSER